MAAFHCKQCNQPFDREWSAFWAEPSDERPRKCTKCGTELSLAEVAPAVDPAPADEDLGDETFSALSSGIIDTKRPGLNGGLALEREAQALARSLVRAQLMDAVSDGPPWSRDEEDTVVIGPLASRAKRAALAKMAADREAKAAAAAAEQEKTLATTPSDELLEMSAPDASEAPETISTDRITADTGEKITADASENIAADASEKITADASDSTADPGDRITADRITMDVEAARAVQSSTSEPERQLPAPPPRPAPLVIEDVLEEIEAAPVSDGGTPSLQALIGHPVAELPHGMKQIPVRDKSRVPKPPERHKDDIAAESAAADDEVVESVDLSTVEVSDPADSERSSDVSVPPLPLADSGEVPTLAPTNVTAPPVQATVAAAASKSRWATPLSFAALGSLFAVIVALRTPKATEEPVTSQAERPDSVAAARSPETPAEDVGPEATPVSAVAAAPATPEANAESAPVATTPAPAETAAVAAADAALVPVASATAAKPRLKPKAEPTEPFDASAANASLADAQARASSCRKADDPSGVAQVTITFAPSGRVTTALVAGPPFAGTPTGGCVASTLRSARVPAFVGEPVTVRKTVTIQ